MQDEDIDSNRRVVLQAMGAGMALPSGLDGLGVTDGSSDGEPGKTDETGQGTSLMAARTQFYSQRAVAGKGECFRPNQREIYGPTDINAQTGNGRLSVGINDEGTVTVLRWPYPSYYDQIKYFTLGRDENDEIEVLPNEGAFLGLIVDGTTTWLRNWRTSQRYASDTGEARDYTDVVSTTFMDPPESIPQDLKVTVNDVVAENEDVLVRQVSVVWPQRPADPDLQLVSFANINPVVSKHPQYPIQDWCTEENNQGRMRYLEAEDVLVSELSGIDESTGQPQSVAIAMGFDGTSIDHQVGGDAHEPAAAPAGQTGPTRDAYDAASDAEFPGNDQYIGQATGALVRDVTFEGGGQASAAVETVVLAGAHAPAQAASKVSTFAGKEFETVQSGKEGWLGRLLNGAPLPNTADQDIRALSRRALVTLVTDTEDHPAPEDASRSNNRAIVASIATQAPYGEDWIRDGAYFNKALELIGLGDGGTDWVADRNRWYAAIQQRATDPRPSHPNTPPGNWIMNYYGDGVAGGPIPYEIDETGYGIWTLWSHYQHTHDEDYLKDVYPAIRRAADFLVRCKNPHNGLHCPTWEDDRFQPQRATIVGAALVWLGLKAAKQAAQSPASQGTEAEASQYKQRQHEIGQAIDRHLFGDVAGDGTETPAYGVRIGFPMAEVVWPVGFTPYIDEYGIIHSTPVVDNPFDHPRIRTHLNAVWSSIAPAFDEPESTGATGQYEVKGLIPLAMAENQNISLNENVDVERGIQWIAREHATSDTHIMGEAWKVFEGHDDTTEVRSIISQPHAWEQVLTYMAAMEHYGDGVLSVD